MDLQDMRIFARVAAVQNLSSVGNELGLTPGTISKRIQALEEELSVRLFDRTTRSIRITEEGTMFLDHVERILAEVDYARAAITANVSKPRGRLRIAAPISLAEDPIEPAVCEFMTRYPEIEVHIDLTNRAVNLQEDGYDVAITMGAIGDSSLMAKRLAPDPQIVVASPRYISSHPPIQEPDDLRSHDCLLHSDTQVWSFQRDHQETSVRVSSRLRSDTHEMLRYAALQHLGIVRISERLVAKALQSGALRRVLETYEVTSQSAIWALYPSSRHVLPKLRVFLDFMAEAFRQDQSRSTNPGAPSSRLGSSLTTLQPKLASKQPPTVAGRSIASRR